MPGNPSIVFAHGLSHPGFVLDVIGRDLNDGPTRLDLHLAARVWLILESLRRTE
jgi:hypothetical protein